ncbi:hypothetical protein [Roseiflexus sp.]
MKFGITHLAAGAGGVGTPTTAPNPSRMMKINYQTRHPWLAGGWNRA